MAIQLNTQTAQQQKAPFSAFDTTSNYRSGLTDVARGLDKVAGAALNIQVAKNQQKEKAQGLLAYKASQDYTVDFKDRSDAFTAAIATGDPDKIQEAENRFNELETIGLDYYSPDLDLGGDSAQRAAAKAQADWKAARNSFDTQKNSRIIFGETTDYQSAQRTAATKAVVDNPDGLNVFALNDTLSRFRGEDEEYQVRYDALTTPEEQAGFNKDLASNTTVVSVQNMKTARTLKELEDRKQIVDEHTTHAVETLGMPTSSVEKIETAYRAAKKALSDPTYKLAAGKEEYAKLNASIASFFDVTKSSDMLSMVNNSATDIVKFIENHPEWAAENQEEIDGLMATLALFSPPRNKETGEVTGESFVDDLAIRFLRFGVKNTGNLEDFFTSIDVNEEAVEGETPEQKLAREARVAVKTQYENLPDNIQTRMQSYMDKRTKFVIDGVNNGDLTSLGNLYPRLERLIEANKWDDVRMFYKDIVLPQLTGAGISTGLAPTGTTGRGTLNGQLRLPTEWAVLGDKEVDLENNPEQATQDVISTVVANQDNPGAALVTISQLNDKSETRLLESMALRVAASGGNVVEITDAMTTRAQLAIANEDNKEIDQIIESRETQVVPEGDALHLKHKRKKGALTFLTRIKNLEGTRDNAEGEFWRQQLRGHIAQSLNQGKSPEEAFRLAEKYHDEVITPLFGVAATSTQGHGVRLAPSTTQKFLDVNESRATGPFVLLYAFKNESEGKINERDLAEFTKASIIALAMRQNPDLYIDLTYGDRAYALGTNLQTPGYVRVAGPGPGAGEGERPQAPENLDDVTDEQLRALYEGLNNNEFSEAGVGLFGPKGDGIPVVNIPETTFITEKIPLGNGEFRTVEKEYYYMQFANSSGKYEEGAGTYVAVDDVNRLLDEVVRRATDMIPFNQPLGDILSSATGNQNAVWNLSAGLYLD
jgi:hypothetical protein